MDLLKKFAPRTRTQILAEAKGMLKKSSGAAGAEFDALMSQTVEVVDRWLSNCRPEGTDKRGEKTYMFNDAIDAVNMAQCQVMTAYVLSKQFAVA